jgi:hypothetical protein
MTLGLRQRLMAAATAAAALYNIIIYKGAQKISFKRINQVAGVVVGDVVGRHQTHIINI